MFPLPLPTSWWTIGPSADPPRTSKLEAVVGTAGAFDSGAFDSPPPGAFDTSSAVDLTPDLTDDPVHITRGFQSAAPDDLVAGPSICEFYLNNTAHNSVGIRGYYSPDFSGGLAGWVEGIRFQYSLTLTGTTWTRFNGWISKIEPDAGIYGTQRVKVTAIGWLGLAATIPVSAVTSQTDKTGDQLIQSLIDISNVQPLGKSLDIGIDVYPYAFDDLDPAKSTVIDGLDSIAKSGLDRIWEKADGTLIYENRNTRAVAASPSVAITDVPTLTYPSLAVVDESSFNASRNRDSLPTLWKVTVHPRRIDESPVVLTSLPITSSTPSISPGASLTLESTFTDPAQPAQQIGAFNTLISNGGGGETSGSSGLLPLADYLFVSPSGVDVSALVSVTVAYGTSQVTWTITNTTSETINIAKLQCRGQGIYAYQPFIGSAPSTGITQPGQVIFEMECPYQSSADFAAAAAKWLATVFGRELTDLPSISLYIPAVDDTTLNYLFTNVDISTAITVTETVTGLSATFWVNSEELEIDERHNIKLTYGLQRTSPITAATWKLGVSLLGVDTFLGSF